MCNIKGMSYWGLKNIFKIIQYSSKYFKKSGKFFKIIQEFSIFFDPFQTIF